MIPINKIREAQIVIKDYIKETECVYSEELSKITGANIYLKLENTQLTNSFKIRGALNKILSLRSEDTCNGVVCASAGNHAQGVAMAAKIIGVSADIVMPLNTPINKITATKKNGGNVILFGDCFDDSYTRALELQNERGSTLIHPFNDLAVMAGQGTIGVEIFEEVPVVINYVIGAVGGGGLMSGVGSAFKQLSSVTNLIGVQAKNAPAMIESLNKREWCAVQSQPSIAEGANVSRPGKETFKILLEVLDGQISVSEVAIKNAIKLFYETHNIKVEGAGALPLAAILERPALIDKGANCVLIVSGGNIDDERFKEIIK